MPPGRRVPEGPQRVNPRVDTRQRNRCLIVAEAPRAAVSARTTADRLVRIGAVVTGVRPHEPTLGNWSGTLAAGAARQARMRAGVPAERPAQSFRAEEDAHRVGMAERMGDQPARRRRPRRLPMTSLAVGLRSDARAAGMEGLRPGVRKDPRSRSWAHRQGLLRLTTCKSPGRRFRPSGRLATQWGRWGGVASIRRDRGAWGSRCMHLSARGAAEGDYGMSGAQPQAGSSLARFMGAGSGTIEVRVARFVRVASRTFARFLSIPAKKMAAKV